MKEKLIVARNSINRFFYKTIFKTIVFQIDPEKVHDRILKVGRVLGANAVTRGFTSFLFSYSNKRLEQKILGIKFSNPIGLAAGFDKEADLTDTLPSVGFGHAEVGSITGEPCEGNKKPRLWRLKKSKGLVVYYGLKNEGCEKISKKLKNKKFTFPIGTSIAKTNNRKTVEVQAGIDDYVKAYKKFTGIGSYFTINISCPNTFGGEPFTNADWLDQLLVEIDKVQTRKPVFLKISPDLSKQEIDQILVVVERHKIDGFVCSNLTKLRKNKNIIEKSIPEKGGISGKVVEDLSNEMISYIYKKTKGKYVIVGCGGVFSAEDAYKKIKLGASLIQLITGMIFEGPQLISEINQGLASLNKKDGYHKISEAVGTGVK
jgi:dihydroorotate dehydrogenase